MEQEQNNNLVNINSQGIGKVNENFADRQKLDRGNALVNKILAKEETLVSRFLPSKEDKARRDMDAALIRQELGNRNKMLNIVGETQIKNFVAIANTYLADNMIQSKTYLAKRFTEAINDSLEHLEREQRRFNTILQQKDDYAQGLTGRLAQRLQAEADREIDSLIDKFAEFKMGLIIDLHGIKDNLLK